MLQTQHKLVVSEMVHWSHQISILSENIFQTKHRGNKFGIVIVSTEQKSFEREIVYQWKSDRVIPKLVRKSSFCQNTYFSAISPLILLLSFLWVTVTNKSSIWKFSNFFLFYLCHVYSLLSAETNKSKEGFSSLGIVRKNNYRETMCMR